MPSLPVLTTFGLMLSLFSLSAMPAAAQTTIQNGNQTQVQTQSGADASAGTAISCSATAPPNAKPTKAKKIARAKKEKKPKMKHVKVERGTLTVDGLTGKAALNYDIADLHFLYMYVPGSGTVVVARSKFAGAKEQTNAFHDNGLTVNASGHIVELYSERTLISKKPESAWVRVDTSYNPSSRNPIFGYGDTDGSPYSWPAALQVNAETGVMNAPPLPRSVLPAYVSNPKLVRISTSSAAASASAQCQNE